LSTTDLTYLHPTFGSYFPNLKVQYDEMLYCGENVRCC
jgi:hypothetical protein